MQNADWVTNETSLITVAIMVQCSQVRNLRPRMTIIYLDHTGACMKSADGPSNNPLAEAHNLASMQP